MAPRQTSCLSVVPPPPAGAPPCLGWVGQESWGDAGAQGPSPHPSVAGAPGPQAATAARAHLEVFEAQLAAEELVLLPHVLLQVPEEAEGRQFRALRALMLKQLPGETPRAAPRPRRHSASPSGAERAPARAGGAGARRTGTPTGARHCSAHGVGAAPTGMAVFRVSRAPTLCPCRGASPSPGRGSLPRQLHPFMVFSCHGLRAQLPGARVCLTEPQKAGIVRYTRVLSLSSPPAPASSATAGGC